MDNVTYQKMLKKQTRTGEIKRMCAYCGEDDPRVLEDHHIAGRANSDVVITLCLNHHKILTAEQNKFPPKARAHNAPTRDKLAFLLFTLLVTLEQIITTLKDFCFQIIDGVTT
jgi:hypothetical protein